MKRHLYKRARGRKAREYNEQARIDLLAREYNEQARIDLLARGKAANRTLQI